MKKRNGEAECCDIGLGLMMQKTHQTHQSFPRKKMNTAAFQLSRGGAYGGGETCGGGWEHHSTYGGPLYCNTNNSPVSSSDGYNAVGSDFGLKPLQQQQPSSDHTLTFNSSGGGMVNSNMRINFTPAQREELVRQATIYKYIVSSVPVPPQLLVSITKKPSTIAHLYPNLVKSLEWGHSSSSDPEPWRCKRTDGKKWRCSRDVAPDQKYCERHLHKTKGRSRKPVESHPNMFMNNNNKNTTMRSPRSQFFKNNINSNMESAAAAAATSLVQAQPRSLAWFMNGENHPAGGSDNWEQMVPFKLGLRSSYTKCQIDVDVSKQQNEESLNLYGGALNSNPTQQTRHFIDAWSTAGAAEGEDCNIGEIGNNIGYDDSTNQKLPFSSLTLSMSRGNNEAIEESESTQMGLGVLGAERENVGDLIKSQWMMPMSWRSSPPGGPLAEALCPGITSSSRGGSSSRSGGSASCRSSSGDVGQEFDLIN